MQNDPSLHTLKGIEAALEETIGERAPP